MKDEATKPLTVEESEIRMTLLATPSSVVLARELVRYALNNWGYHKEIIDDSVLVMSEIVTNAVNVAAGHRLRIRITTCEGAPLLECWDPAAQLPHARTADLDAESGRGLLLVSTLAKDTGVRPAATGPGKIVWALMQI